MTPAQRRAFERQMAAECIALGLLFLILYPFAKLAEVLS